MGRLDDIYGMNRKAVDGAFSAVHSLFGDDSAAAADNYRHVAVRKVLNCLDVAVPEDGSLPETVNEISTFLLNEGVFNQKIVLDGTWWKWMTGPMMTIDGSGRPVALLPSKLGYEMFGPDTPQGKKVNARVAAGIGRDAVCYYRSLGKGVLGKKDILKFALKCISLREYLIVGIFCLAAALLGLLVPMVTKKMFSDVIPSGIMKAILPLCCLLIGSGFSAVLSRMCRDLVLVRMKDKIKDALQPAVMARVLSFSPSFHKKYSSSELTQRILSINTVGETVSYQVLGNFMGGIFSFLYIIITILYASDMIWVLMSILALFAIFLNYIRIYCGRCYGKSIPATVVVKNFTFNAISGLQKIKNNKAEFRAFSRWAKLLSKSEPVHSESPLCIKNVKLPFMVANFYAIFISYFGAWYFQLPVSSYIAYMSALGLMLAAIGDMFVSVMVLLVAKPQLALLEPILTNAPEERSNRETVDMIFGSIDVDHLSFSYGPDSPKVIDDISFSIGAGEKVGLVGKSGCGKSTLMRLLLGFEKLSSGTIFFDQYSIEKVNLPGLRQYVGFCPQSLQVFPGTIADNIRLSNFGASDEEIWEAARVAAIDEDIKKLPLGMNTILGEGGAGLSGGQCQRLMIARAVLSKPRILFFDEATSALDNISQKKVTENLDTLGCTVISIAHRLSTVMTCSRIIVLDKGKIVEDGAPKDLLEAKGFFYTLCKRQELS